MNCGRYCLSACFTGETVTYVLLFDQLKYICCIKTFFEYLKNFHFKITSQKFLYHVSLVAMHCDLLSVTQTVTLVGSRSNYIEMFSYCSSF